MSAGDRELAAPTKELASASRLSTKMINSGANTLDLTCTDPDSNRVTSQTPDQSPILATDGTTNKATNQATDASPPSAKDKTLAGYG